MKRMLTKTEASQIACEAVEAWDGGFPDIKKKNIMRAFEEDMKMKIKLDTGACMPERAHEEDAGLDIKVMYGDIVPAHGSRVFKTGLHVELPKGTAGVLVSKSGLNVNHDITSTGLIDEGYTGEIRVKLYNHGDEDYLVHHGDKVSQLIIVPVLKPELEEVEDLEGAERGNNGFGSTGR